MEPKAADETEVAPQAWPRTVTLKQPFKFGDEHVTSLTFRRGKLGDIKGMKLSDSVPVEQLMMIASRLCGRPVPMLEMVDMDDAGEVTQIALDFYVSCLAAGKKS